MILLIFVVVIIQSIYSSPVITLGNIKKANVGCEINPFEASPTPILIQQNEFIYPSGATATTIKLDAQETIDVACPGGYILANGKNTKLSIATISCESNTQFELDNDSYTFKQIVCSKNPITSSQLSGKTCEFNHLPEVEIGFEITDSLFLKTISICFNESTQTALFSTTNIPSSINQQLTNNPRPSWQQGRNTFAIDDVNAYYIRNKQRSTINTLLGLSSSDTKYIQNNNDFFLSRGHLIARSDFFYGAQQNSTFYLENVLPQWQTFNGGNWNEIEISIRDYAEAKNVDLQLWTGGHGVTTLPHKSTEQPIPLYIYTDNNEELIPVPEIYWKIVYNPINKNGVVLIGINNPYKSLDEIDIFCEDQSDQLTWLSWKPDDQTKGFSWACTVDDFRQTVQYTPNIVVNGLLI